MKNHNMQDIFPSFDLINKNKAKQDQGSIAGPLRKLGNQTKNPDSTKQAGPAVKKSIKIVLQLGLDLKFTISRS